MWEVVTAAWLEQEAFDLASGRWALSGFILLMFLCFALLERLLWNKSYIMKRKYDKNSYPLGVLILLTGSFFTRRIADKITGSVTASRHPDAALETPEYTEYLGYRAAVKKNMVALSSAILLGMLFLLVVALSLRNCWNETRQSGDPAWDTGDET